MLQKPVSFVVEVAQSGLAQADAMEVMSVIDLELVVEQESVIELGSDVEHMIVVDLAFDVEHAPRVG